MSAIECPKCKTAYSFRPEFAGKTAQCEKCSQEFVFPADLAATATNLKPAPSGAKTPKEAVQIDAGFPSDHVPPQLGEVVKQWPYRQSLWSSLKTTGGLFIITLYFTITLFTGGFDDLIINHTLPAKYLMWTVTPIFAILTVMAARAALANQARPRVIAVMKTGVYMPLNRYSWKMIFIPFHSDAKWSRAEDEIGTIGKQDIFEANGSKGLWPVASVVFPSKEEFEVFVTMVKQGVKGELT